MNKVFVTGPDGLLGNHVIRELINRKFEVVAMVQSGKDSPSLNHLPIQIVYGDITLKADVVALSKGCNYLIHIAAITDLWPSKAEKYFQVNVQGTANAIEAALTNGVKRFIHIGSASSFRCGDEHNPGNESEFNPFSEYDLDYMKSKHLGQNLVLQAVKSKQLPALVLCPTFMIGAYDSKPSSGTMLLAIAKNKLPYVAGGGKNWVSAKSVASAVCNALDKGRIGECYILGGENVTFREMVKTMAAVVGKDDSPKPVIPDFLVYFAGAVSSFYSKLFNTSPKISYPMARIACIRYFYSPAKAVRELEMTHEPIENALIESKQWFEENGYL